MNSETNSTTNETTDIPVRGSGPIIPVAVFCLFFSGLAGLIYQVVWTRYLGLLTGHTSYAIVAVLVAFMGGLALGNAWLGQVADRLRRPLAFYGWIEVVIGIYALAFPSIFEIAYGAYIGMAKGVGGGSMALLLKFLVALVLLLVPTVLMGGTLPVLTRMITHSLGEIRNRVSTLYFINSLGAVVGVGAAEFWLIPVMGLKMSVFYGAGINLLVGVIALLASGYVREEKNTAPAAADKPKATESEETFSARDIRLATVGIAVSGGVAMLYEIAWTRLLALTMGSTSAAFAIMLMTFILGIAIGAWIVGRLRNIRDSLHWFAWMEIGVGASVILMMFLYSQLPYQFINVAFILNRSAESYPLFQLIQGTFSFGVMIIPTIILGMTLPLVSRISTAEVTRTGRSVGLVFSFNTIGAVLGTLITGLWAMPALGLARTFALGTGLNIAIGIVILYRNATPAQRKLVPMVLPGVVLWMILAQSLFHKEWSALTTIGAYRYRVNPPSFKAFKDTALQYQMVYHRDGAGSTVTVRTGGNNPHNIFLSVNGKADASNGADLINQLLPAHVPAMLHRNPESALVIGFGSGATSGALLTHPTIRSVESVEISPEVVVAARYFESINEGVLDDERNRIHIDDAKSFLSVNANKYDIITSQPSNPWMAGVPGLYTLEFYQQCADHLNEGGLMCQWLQLYDVGDDAVDTILATFTRIFPHTSVWATDTGNLLLVGSAKPQQPDLDKFLDRFSNPRIRSSLAKARISRPATLLALQIMSEDFAPYAFPGTTQIHSDYFPVLDHLAQLGSYTGGNARGIFRFDQRKVRRSRTLLTDYFERHPIVEDDIIEILSHNDENEILDAALVRSLCGEWTRQAPKNPAPNMVSAGYQDTRTPTASDVALMSFSLSQIVANPRRGVEWTTYFAYSAMNSYRFSRTAFYQPDTENLVTIMAKLAETYPNEAHIYNCYLAELAWDKGDFDRFLKLATGIFVDLGDQLGLASFPDGEIGPAIILTRLIDHFITTGDPERLAKVVQVAETAGFANTSYPRLLAAVTRAKRTGAGAQ